MTTTLGSRSTATDALRGISLNGKIAIVTGASSGIGIETARVLARAGATVVMAVRNVSAGEAVAKTLRPESASTVEVLPLDLTDLDSVRTFARSFRARYSQLHLLINNAGVMATPLGQTAQGFELQVGTNHLGHFALTMELLPMLETTDGARVVNLSSDLHRRGRAQRLITTLEQDPGFQNRKYVPFDSYGDSKLANILFTRALARRAPKVGVYAVHPGVIPTNLTRSMGALGAAFRVLGGLFMKNVEQGAATSIYAATAPELAGRSGSYLSDCAVLEPSGDARNDQAAERVWALSVEAVSTTSADATRGVMPKNANATTATASV